MKTDIRRYLATDVAARQLKLDTETERQRAQSKQTFSRPPFRKIWQSNRLKFSRKSHSQKASRFQQKFLKLNKLSVPNQRRTPYAGAELGKFDPNQQTLEKGFRYLRSQV